MPADFESGFFVRKPAWHGMGTVVDDYPDTREKAKELAGHNWEPEVLEVFRRRTVTQDGKPVEIYEPVPDYREIVRSDTRDTLHISRDSYAASLITNDELYDVTEALLNADKHVKYETGGVLEQGRLVWLLAYLDEPVQLPGDNSAIYPFLAVQNRHDGQGSCSGNFTTVRVVCANTAGMADMEGKRNNAQFNFRHTKNWRDRVEEAKQTIHGMRAETAKYVEFATHLLGVEVSDEQREAFIAEFAPMPPEGLISTWVRNHVLGVRDDMRTIFASPTTAPIAHTAYGCVQAAGEYLDHVRGYRSQETYFKRTMLRSEPLKAKAVKTIERVLADDSLVAKSKLEVVQLAGLVGNSN